MIICSIFAAAIAIPVFTVLCAVRLSGRISQQEVDEGALEGDLTGYVHDLNAGAK